MTYDFLQHRHRFAAWCAATAASASPKCRFKVQKAFSLLEGIDIARQANEKLWNDYATFDEWHIHVCNSLMDQAHHREVRGFSYGVAAKMINCYIKAFYLGDQAVLSQAHPPIDRLLLTELLNNDVNHKAAVWRKYRDKGWSNFSRADYQAVINALRSDKDTRLNMWTVECHWPGYRDQ